MSKLKKLLIAIVAIVFVLVLAFVGTFWWMNSKAKSAEAKQHEVEKEYKTVVHKIEDSIISNLSDSKSVNIRVAVNLSVRDEEKEDKKFITEFTEDDGLAITTIIAVLRSKTVKEVTEDSEAPIKLGKEITEKLNKAYHTDRFIATYFREFITQ